VVERALSWLCLSVLVCGVVGCAGRNKLHDTHLLVARSDEQQGLASLYVYPSHRTVSRYQRSSGELPMPGEVIEQPSDRETFTLVLGKRTAGVIVGEELVNGARQLWVCFNRSCGPNEIYGFIQVGNDEYRLNEVPGLGERGPAKVHRSYIAERRVMQKGKMNALSDPNDVYRATRKRYGGRTVFLEVRIAQLRRKKTGRGFEPGGH
jgi:hypothetical protein